MPLTYSIIEIYTSEQARYRKVPVADAVVRYISGLKIAARCMVARGVQGCFENGELATQSILDLSFNMPIKIEVLLPAAELEAVLPELEDIVCEGVVVTRQADVHSHRTRRRLLPPQIKIKDIMTPNPKAVSVSTPLGDVAKLLLSVIFSGVPVVDTNSRPVGILTQGDLVLRAGLPMRIGLLAASPEEKLDAVLSPLAQRTVEEVMSSPAVTIGEDEPATKGVHLMMHKGLKRLPVVDRSGKLTGMLSRLDIFQTVMKESPDWSTFQAQKIEVGNLQQVSDIMRRDTYMVSPETSLEDVIRIIDSNDIQRVAVVGDDHVFLGMISDRDLLTAFMDKHPGIIEYFAGKIPFSDRGRKQKELTRALQAQTAGEVMKTDIITVHEQTSLDEALGVMTAKGFKRLPVVNGKGRFKGMISRDALLRTGFSASSCPWPQGD